MKYKITSLVVYHSVSNQLINNTPASQVGTLGLWLWLWDTAAGAGVRAVDVGGAVAWVAHTVYIQTLSLVRRVNHEKQESLTNVSMK